MVYYRGLCLVMHPGILSGSVFSITDVKVHLQKRFKRSILFLERHKTNMIQTEKHLSLVKDNDSSVEQLASDLAQKASGHARDYLSYFDMVRSDPREYVMESEQQELEAFIVNNTSAFIQAVEEYTVDAVALKWKPSHPHARAEEIAYDEQSHFTQRAIDHYYRWINGITAEFCRELGMVVDGEPVYPKLDPLQHDDDPLPVAETSSVKGEASYLGMQSIISPDAYAQCKQYLLTYIETYRQFDRLPDIKSDAQSAKLAQQVLKIA